ncbi:circumsporozoite protein-like [Helianthus annuus]|uniref:circumsporozoite protein-like n=1 Tax=Helianthus annuus TaxID=4232 RepID=UPI000B8F640C|nr:circumsporozoite protein-like [Helianthus annuus]
MEWIKANDGGSPYQGPNEWDQCFNQFTFVNTPPYPHPQTPSPPQEDEPMEPADQQPQPPPQPRKPRGSRSPYQGPNEWDQCFNQFTFVNTPPYPHPQTPSPPQEDEPMEPADQQPQPPPQPRKPRGSPTPMDYNYPAPSYDPYLQAVMHNALYPSPFPPA